MNWKTPTELADILESGKYKKGTDALRTEVEEGTCYCCLGVLALESGVADSSLDGYGTLFYSTGEPLFFIGRDEEGHPTWSEDPPVWLTREVETRLCLLNDEHNNWGPVVEYLRSL